MDERQRESEYFYIWKAFACMLVVFIHYPISGELGRAVGALARIAVPVFFAITGWYLLPSADRAAQQQQMEGKIRKTAVQFVKIILIYDIFSFFVNVFLYDADLLNWLLGKISLVELLKLAVFNTGGLIADRSYDADFMWYFAALLQCYVLLWLWLKKSRTEITEKAGKAALVLLICFFVVQAAVPSELMLYRNGLLTGMPCILIGIWSQNHGKIIFSRVPTWIWLLLSVLERHFLGKHEIYIGTILALLSILNRDHFSDFDWLPEKLRALLLHIGKDLSANVYYYHVLLGTVIGLVFGEDNARNVKVLLVALVLAELLYRLRSLRAHRAGHALK